MQVEFQIFGGRDTQAEIYSFKDLAEYIGNCDFSYTSKEQEAEIINEWIDDAEDEDCLSYYNELIDYLNTLTGNVWLKVFWSNGNSKVIVFNSSEEDIFKILLKNEFFARKILNLHYLNVDNENFIEYKKASASEKNFNNAEEVVIIEY
ncbi:hypothetical protein CQA57_07020 [Helicobacter anseris]|uniref:Uncharacterized protein n=1 Tax=Helicobacter anseris TaxID=375926 RepID=A0A3D8J4B9_9HELI|nr:hypothetical protein [Helicobacter anseris]RDU72347.1 hypothetical protein CQA57_07020 [Helicobacter anseris]